MREPTTNRHGDAVAPPVRPLRRRLRRPARRRPAAGGLPGLPLVHAAEVAARRQRRYRQRQQERAESVAYSRERQAAYQARRLLAEHPAAVEVLVDQVSPEVADLVIDELLRRRAAGDQKGG